MTQQTLQQLDIGLNLYPPKGEPGTKWQRICLEEHVEAVRQALAYKKEHPDEIVEIWPRGGNLREVVRQVAK